MIILVAIIAAGVGGALVMFWWTHRMRRDIPSPRNRILTSDLTFFAQYLTLDTRRFRNVRQTDVQNTESMDPTIDAGNKIIICEPDIPSLQAGDIVIVQDTTHHIMHRISKVGTDAEGWYCRTKSDRSAIADPVTWREEHVKAMMIGNLN